MMDSSELEIKNRPPEKYYEACITYHLVNEFKQRFDIELYPFSISQIEEYTEGYDFGYKFSCDSFVIQYKRPDVYSNGEYYWKINREQLDKLNSNNYKLRAYYALPAFIDTNKWFEGFESTFFVEAAKLQYFLKSKINKNNNINSKSKILEDSDHFIKKYDYGQKNLAYAEEVQSVTMKDIIQLANGIEKEMRNNTWVYLMRE